MTSTPDEAGLPPRRSDEEIRAAVGDDPDEAPLLTEEEARARRARLVARDRYGVLRLCWSLGIGSPEIANRLKVPWQRVLRWERGEEEPDAEARRKLDELARDPALLARKEETRTIGLARLAEMEREDQELDRDPWGVAALRRRLGLSRTGFAERYGVTWTTLSGWERGRTEPDAAEKVLLAAIARDPEGVAQAARRAGERAYLAGEAA